MKLNKIYIVENQIDKDNFIKEFLLNLAINPKTSYDIFEQFAINDINIEYDHYYDIEGTGTYKVSCDIGYKREILNNNGKKEIVYDWSYYSDKIAGSKQVLLKDGDNKELNTSFNQGTYRNIIMNNINKRHLDMDQEMPYPNVNLAEKMIETSITNQIKIPGDMQRYKQIQGKTQITSIIGYKIPKMVLNYKYKENEYNASAILNKVLEINYVYPLQNKELPKKNNSEKMQIRLNGLNEVYKQLGFPLLTDAEKRQYYISKDDINLLSDEQKKTLKKLLIIGCCCCFMDLGIIFIIRALKKKKWIEEAKQKMIEVEKNNVE